MYEQFSSGSCSIEALLPTQINRAHWTADQGASKPESAPPRGEVWELDSSRAQSRLRDIVSTVELVDTACILIVEYLSNHLEPVYHLVFYFAPLALPVDCLDFSCLGIWVTSLEGPWPVLVGGLCLVCSLGTADGRHWRLANFFLSVPCKVLL